MRLESLLAERASVLGGKPFCIDVLSGETLSYAQMLQGARAAANALTALGVGRGHRVVFPIANRLQSLPALFGIWGCGAVAVLLDSRLTEAEMQSLIAFVEPDLVVGEGTLRELLRGSARAGFPAAEGDEEDTAAILFTSGSTGNPKGVMLSHGALLRNSQALVRGYGFDEAVRALHGLPLFTIYGLGDMTLTPLLAGGTVLLHPLWDVFALSSFWEIAAASRATFFGLVPTLVNLMLRFTSYDPALPLSSMRFGVSASAPLFPDANRRFEETFHCRLGMAYGITEGGGKLTFCSPLACPRLYGSVGKPLDCDIRLTDQGEVIIRSDRLMSGYFRNPRATQEVLRDGWLYSGDVGRFDEHGNLYLVSRRKDIVIRSGLKVCLTEVDEALSSHPAIAEVATIGEPGADGDERLHAFVVPLPGSHLTVELVTDYARGRLAAYKCPTSITLTDSLPKSGNGKILKEALRA